MKSRLRRVQPAIGFAALNLDADLSLPKLAAQTGLSPFHLHRLFTELTGETPKQLTQRLRLERAAASLLSSSDKVLDIAIHCGFQSHEVFARSFRARFGLTPTAYRRRGLTEGADATRHAQFVAGIGPCVGLYRTSEIPEGQPMNYSIEKRTLTPQRVLLVRRRVAPSQISAAIAEGLGPIFHYAQSEGIALTGHPLTRYPEVGLGLVTLEPCMRVAAAAEEAVAVDASWISAGNKGDVMHDLLPGGAAAVTMHTGPYDQLRDAYAALEAWIETQGLKKAGAPWESYITDPGTTPDPKDWKTEVFWPVEV